MQTHHHQARADYGQTINRLNSLLHPLTNVRADANTLPEWRDGLHELFRIPISRSGATAAIFNRNIYICGAGERVHRCQGCRVRIADDGLDAESFRKIEQLAPGGFVFSNIAGVIRRHMKMQRRQMRFDGREFVGRKVGVQILCDVRTDSLARETLYRHYAKSFGFFGNTNLPAKRSGNFPADFRAAHGQSLRRHCRRFCRLYRSRRGWRCLRASRDQTAKGPNRQGSNHQASNFSHFIRASFQQRKP